MKKNRKFFTKSTTFDVSLLFEDSDNIRQHRKTKDRELNKKSK